MIKINNIEVEAKRFPDGTFCLLDCTFINNKSSSFVISWFFDNNEDQVLLYNIVKHLKENVKSPEIVLNIPYVPNARMDRVKDPKECFTLKYFCEFINSLEVDRVNVTDVHSDVTLNLINNCYNISTDRIVKNLVKTLKVDYLFFPDAGAVKKYTQYYELPYLYGEKNRKWGTGEITSLTIKGDIPQEPFDIMIVDDICSYGTTFLRSAEKLKEVGAGEIYLWVTHCENSILKGELINSDLISGIYTTDSIFTKEHHKIVVLPEFRG